MTTQQSNAVVDYYTDILCVWAWIAQPRLDKLCDEWRNRITVRYRYVDVFGDAHTKIPGKWGQQDGFDRFAEHVQQSGADHSHTHLHPDLWRVTRPRSSLPAHLVLKAASLVAGKAAEESLALAMRRAFFCEARDIGDMEVLLSVADAAGVNVDALRNAVRSGEALAGLSADQRDAQALAVRGSPTWVLNDGRQLLYGNVGYRILQANVEELINRPEGEASWC
jgi:predicted DsbA family dithiol-disulfide isomerase